MSILPAILLFMAGLSQALTNGEDPTDEWTPTKAQAIRYLEGKRIEWSPDEMQPNVEKRSLDIKKGQIVAVEFGTGSQRDGDGPCQTKIIFIVQQRHKRYAVEGIIRHKRVSTDRAFYGLTVKQVTEQ